MKEAWAIICFLVFYELGLVTAFGADEAIKDPQGFTIGYVDPNPTTKYTPVYDCGHRVLGYVSKDGTYDTGFRRLLSSPSTGFLLSKSTCNRGGATK